MAPAGVSAHQQRGHPKASARRGADVVEPSTPVVVGPEEGRAPPGVAHRERRKQPPHETLAGRDPARWMLARPGRGDVCDLGKVAVPEVLVVLLEIGDAAKEPGVLDVTAELEQRHPSGLDAGVGASVRLQALAGVVVLDVELPRDPGCLEPVEDRGPRRPGPSRDPEHVVGHAAAGRGGEEPVEENVVLRDPPVEGQVAAVVVPHGGALHPLAVDRGGSHETVHASPGVLEVVRATVVAQVGDGTAAQAKRPHAGTFLAAADRHAGLVGYAVRARKGSEVVVERVVLLHQHDEVPDRGLRLAGGCRRRARSRRSRRTGRAQPETSWPHREDHDRRRQRQLSGVGRGL